MEKQARDILTFIERAIENKVEYRNDLKPERNQQLETSIEAYREIKRYIKVRC